MSEEEVLDSSVRNAILGRVANLGKKQEEIKEKVVQKTTQIVETKNVCSSCGHKVWHDGEEWCHSGMSHDTNCECREVKVSNSSKKASVKKVFDASTPFNELLEACAESHNAIKAEDEEASKVADETRQKLIEKINSQTSILKDWRF